MRHQVVLLCRVQFIFSIKDFLWSFLQVDLFNLCVATCTQRDQYNVGDDIPFHTEEVRNVSCTHIHHVFIFDITIRLKYKYGLRNLKKIELLTIVLFYFLETINE